MIDSIPLSALELGFGFQEYKEISRNIRRVRFLSPEKKQEILDRANKKLSPEITSNGLRLVKDMTGDREVYLLAELSYAQGPPEGEGLFTTAVADYLLRNH